MDQRLAAFLVLVLGGCTAFGGLAPGRSDLADIERTLGAPALTWGDDQGRTHLAYPRGPMGYETWMMLLDPAGRLERIENALDEHHFALIKPGMTQEQVLHVIGPPYAPWTVYYPARDELAWEWRYCDVWQEASRFDVLFDGTRKTVRSTLRLPELCGRAGNCAC